MTTWTPDSREAFWVECPDQRWSGNVHPVACSCNGSGRIARSTDELVLWLASLPGTTTDRCGKNFHEVVTVPRYHGLQRKCRNATTTPAEALYGHTETCGCQGRGWLPVTDLEALLEAAGVYALQRTPRGHEARVKYMNDGRDWWTNWTEAPTPELAVALALCLATWDRMQVTVNDG